MLISLSVAQGFVTDEAAARLKIKPKVAITEKEFYGDAARIGLTNAVESLKDNNCSKECRLATCSAALHLMINYRNTPQQACKQCGGGAHPNDMYNEQDAKPKEKECIGFISKVARSATPLDPVQAISSAVSTAGAGARIDRAVFDRIVRGGDDVELGTENVDILLYLAAKHILVQINPGLKRGLPKHPNQNRLFRQPNLQEIGEAGEPEAVHFAMTLGAGEPIEDSRIRRTVDKFLGDGKRR